MAAHESTPQTVRPGAIATVVGLPLALRIALVGATLVAATAAVALLEHVVGVADASPLYLIAVVLAAALLGTWGAVATSVAAFLVYDFTFTTPRFTFVVSDPAEWLNLLLFLLVAVVLGQMVAVLRERADEADRRARESEALVAISRDIAIAGSFEEAAAAVASRLQRDAEMQAVWITLASRPGATIAESGSRPGDREAPPWTLVQATPDGGSDWLRVHDGTVAEPGGGDRPDGLADRYSVAIGPFDGAVGWIHATRAAGAAMPGRGARRLLTLSADQLGIAYRRDELRAAAMAAEVARQSDALRAAILDSVSHDLRTPIASIRALAGGLADPATSPDLPAVRHAAASIDEQGARLAGLVNGLLDMGRIQAGGIHADLRPYDLRELVETTLRRLPAAPGPLVEIPDDLPPVLADAVLFDVVLGNVLDNAVVHAPSSTIRVAARSTPGQRIELAVDDSGPGVPPDELPLLFDRFYRGQDVAHAARRGLGMGLAIARGFAEAMGGSIDAGSSDLGGLRIVLTLQGTGTLAVE